MAESQSVSESLEEVKFSMEELNKIVENSKLKKGAITKHILNTTEITRGELLRKERIGEKDEKPHKVILLVGETGTGKTAVINAMVNYFVGIRWENRMWLEVVETPDEQSNSQTKVVTVYEVFTQNSPFALSIIDIPGIGDTEGHNKDTQTAEALQQLFRSEDGIHEIHAVCLVLKASDVRLHERQLYVLNEILSLFGKDIENHMLLLFTHCSTRLTKKHFNFIRDSGIKCAKTKDGQPVHFTFDNSQSEFCEDEETFRSTLDHWIKSFKQFFDYLNGINPVSLNMTEGVLRARKQLDASVNNLKDRIEWAEQKKTELVETKAAVIKFENYKKEKKDFTYEVNEVNEVYKEEVLINASWWHFSKQATRCTECKENCHFPGCWWVKDVSKCSVMKEGKCTICSGKCDHTKHVKDEKKYETKTKPVKRTYKDLKEKYEKDFGENQSLKSKLEREINEIEAEKIRLVEECYQCLEKLMETALKSTSMSSFIHLDFMIEKVKETGNQERVQKLEELKLKALEENKGLFEKLYLMFDYLKKKVPHLGLGINKHVGEQTLHT